MYGPVADKARNGGIRSRDGTQRAFVLFLRHPIQAFVVIWRLIWLLEEDGEP